MDNTQSQFIELLSHSIRGKTTYRLSNNVNWDKILTIAQLHKVEGIIYSSLSKKDMISQLDCEVLKKLQISVFHTGTKQLRNIYNLAKIFSRFDDEEIPVIVLKGLVVRNFYPHPEQRDMNDADILVHKEDLEKVKCILLEMGYSQLEDHVASHHIVFYHYSFPIIEVHWHIVKRDGFSSDINKFEEDIWNNSIKVNVGDSEVRSLCYEDLALHLCMHMASHLAANGFGLRQLCDLVLLVENKGNEISWISFLDKSREYGFDKFNIIIFLLCNRLFHMKVPNELINIKLDQEKYINLLIDEILKGGVYGKKDVLNSFSNQIAFNYECKDNNATLGAIKRYIRFMFPRVEYMSDKYNYAKRYRILIPIALVHHLIAGLFRKEYSFIDKSKFIIKGASISVKKNKLLKWMEL
ncbi:nucleotidyltransferase domain-containing protein [Clostridium sulfidigenes]|uniref:nucleotidyltransferase domain-containing protein n=1 Tax=Clostridium sulfidigenes TaxID=318464 RepID=UPI003F8B2B4D